MKWFKVSTAFLEGAPVICCFKGLIWTYDSIQSYDNMIYDVM